MREPAGQVRVDLGPWLSAAPLIYTNTDHTTLPKRSHHDFFVLQNINCMYMYRRHLVMIDGKCTVYDTINKPNSSGSSSGSSRTYLGLSQI